MNGSVLSFASVEGVVDSGILVRPYKGLLERYPENPVNGSVPEGFDAGGGYLVAAREGNGTAGCGAFRPFERIRRSPELPHLSKTSRETQKRSPESELQTRHTENGKPPDGGDRALPSVGVSKDRALRLCRERTQRLPCKGAPGAGSGGSRAQRHIRGEKPCPKP